MYLRELMDNEFLHFNSREVVQSAKDYERHVGIGGKMIVTLAGALSSAEIGISLSKMISNNFVHVICTTGANFEEDLCRLFCNSSFINLENSSSYGAKEDSSLYAKGYARIGNIGLNLDKSLFKLSSRFFSTLKTQFDGYEKIFPQDIVRVMFDGIDSTHDLQFERPKETSWVYTAIKKGVPILIPAWEDSTLGLAYAARSIKQDLEGCAKISHGLDYTLLMAEWLQNLEKNSKIGFFQIGGGVPGDFAISAIPMLQGAGIEVPKWDYFCQITDSVASYGGYSGAPPSEKISWGKLTAESKSFAIQSDATIVAPLIFNYVLEGVKNGT